MRAMMLIAICMTLVINANAADYDSISEKELDINQLRIITDTMMEICGTFENDGESSKTGILVELSAQIKRFISNIIGAGGEFSAGFDREKFTNVIHEKLHEELKSVRDCRLVIWQDLRKVAFHREITLQQGKGNFHIEPSDWRLAPASRGLALDFYAYIEFDKGHTRGSAPDVSFDVRFPASHPDLAGKEYVFIEHPLNVTERGFYVLLIKTNDIRTRERAIIEWKAVW